MSENWRSQQSRGSADGSGGCREAWSADTDSRTNRAAVGYAAPGRSSGTAWRWLGIHCRGKNRPWNPSLVGLASLTGLFVSAANAAVVLRQRTVRTVHQRFTNNSEVNRQRARSRLILETNPKQLCRSLECSVRHRRTIQRDGRRGFRSTQQNNRGRFRHPSTTSDKDFYRRGQFPMLCKPKPARRAGLRV